VAIDGDSLSPAEAAHRIAALPENPAEAGVYGSYGGFAAVDGPRNVDA
jgi:hypothetical protein